MDQDAIILHGALVSEFKTLEAMVEIYCQANHQNQTGHKAKAPLVCELCQSLLNYAKLRLDRCPYGESKPTCNRCPIHCYKPEPKAQMKVVMIYSGPRMLLKHPILALNHLIKERKKAAGKPTAQASNRAKRLGKY